MSGIAARSRVLGVAALLAAATCVAGAALAAPDEELLGKSRGYPMGTRLNWFSEETVRVGSFSNLDKLLPHHVLTRAPTPLALTRAAAEPPLRYTFGGRSLSIDDYLAHQRATGLLVIKDGEILVERYQYERRDTDRLLSNSMAKSLVSIAMGMALADKRIRSLDDKAADYVPELKGNAYGETLLRNLLRMASGVRFREDYDGKDDLTRFSILQVTRGTIPGLLAFNEREAPQGDRFHYASIETQVLAAVLRAATGQSLSAYLQDRLWQPMGAESDATWITAPDGLERAAGNFNATLRDWGRLGILLANDGMRDGREIIPREYLLEATDWHRHPEVFAPRRSGRYYGYGYQFWTSPGEQRRFALLGVYGQAIYVDPGSKLVLVHTGAAHSARIGNDTMGAELGALWAGLVKTYGQ